MKKLILFLLLPLWAMAQTSTGQEQEFDYGIKNNSTQTITTPPYLTTTGMDGTQGKIPSALIEKTDNKQNSLAVDGTGTKYPTVDAVNAALPKTYTTTVYVNTNNPNTATIFDDENPPTVNDDGLKSNTDNLYIGLDASAWVYSGGEYVTKIIPASSNFYIYSTSIDAGNNKSSTIERFGEIVSKSGNIVRRDGSDSVGGGGYFSFYNNAITSGNTFQLNASNGVDLWNYSSGTWNKRFTFSSDGGITATSAAFSSTVTAPTFVGALTGNASSATSWQGNFYADEDNGNGNYILTTSGGTNVWKYRSIGLFRNDLGLGSNAYTSTAYAPLASPAFTGTPTAPTAPVGTNTPQIATMEALQAAVTSNIAQTITNGVTTSAPSQDAVFDALAGKASLNGSNFTGGISLVGSNSLVLNNGNVQFNSTGKGLTAPNNGGIYFVSNHPATPGWTANTNIKATFYKTTVYTVATLPTTGVESGTYATVSDATAPTYLGTLTGGGTVVCPVFYDGSAWVAH